MDQGHWKQPVTVETRTLGQFRTISSTAEAARTLLGLWPREDGRARRRACETCFAALEAERRQRPRVRHSLKALMRQRCLSDSDRRTWCVVLPHPIWPRRLQSLSPIAKERFAVPAP
jgi:hypothetical protein